MKPRRRESFSEDIGKLILSRDELELKITTHHPFTNKVIVHLDMFCATMEDWI